MQGVGYRLGMAAVVLMTAVALKVLPPPWEGGVIGLFSCLWFACALFVALGYWYKLDQLRDRARQQQLLEQAQRNKIQRRQTGSMV